MKRTHLHDKNTGISKILARPCCRNIPVNRNMQVFIGSKAWNPDQNDVRIFEAYPRQIFKHPSQIRKDIETSFFTNSKSSKHYLQACVSLFLLYSVYWNIKWILDKYIWKIYFCSRKWAYIHHNYVKLPTNQSLQDIATFEIRVLNIHFIFEYLVFRKGMANIRTSGYLSEP